jgi:hypothetical protein
MTGELYFIILLLVFAGLYFIVPPLVGTYLRYRGKRVIVCPETRKPAAVEVDTKHAMASALTGEADLRLSNCTRWPEKKDCGQECLLQLEIAPEECLVRNMLTSWYADKSCVYCGHRFGAIHLMDHKPALLTPEGKTIEWQEIKPELIPLALDTHKPVCWNCHIMRSFCAQHPDMVFESAKRNIQTAGR